MFANMPSKKKQKNNNYYFPPSTKTNPPPKKKNCYNWDPGHKDRDSSVAIELEPSTTEHVTENNEPLAKFPSSGHVSAIINRKMTPRVYVCSKKYYKHCAMNNTERGFSCMSAICTSKRSKNLSEVIPAEKKNMQHKQEVKWLHFICP